MLCSLFVTLFRCSSWTIAGAQEHTGQLYVELLLSSRGQIQKRRTFELPDIDATSTRYEIAEERIRQTQQRQQTGAVEKKFGTSTASVGMLQ